MNRHSIEPNSFQQRISTEEQRKLAHEAWNDYSQGTKEEHEDSFKDGYLLCLRRMLEIIKSDKLKTKE